ncbi:Protein of uncharacterised function (DUF2569) [Raoultella planticola]|uniref:Protein of uncharacterized function (DUF2569) n=1 Tax=Raoultella planticola TaxID=575 RepID=A0A485CY86_RAOPL|nr:Protein of uncharacterised function (DUF2569) [Raoultella planticola]
MSSHSAERIGGWLLAPLAWLLVALLSTSLSLLIFANALMRLPDLRPCWRK